MKKMAILIAMLAAALLASGQGKGTFMRTSIAKCESDGSFIALSDGARFTVEPSYRDISKKLAKGLSVEYRMSPDGRCSHYELETGGPFNQYVCVSPPLSHGGKGITIQVVQMLTKNAIVTESSSFAWAMATLIPKNAALGPSATGQGMSSGTSVSTEITKLVGMDVILNDQKVRLRCAQSPCHGLNANSYTSELKGADVWITSYGLRWDPKQERLVQEEYDERWKIVGAWE
jgi:hypothetical protein